MSHKIDSKFSQGFEARIITPTLLRMVNDFERNLKNGKCKFATTPAISEYFLRTIVAGKNQIYGQMKIGHSNTFRVALCQLMHLNNFLAESETKPAKSAKTNKKMLPKWDPSLACNSEQQIENAFVESRKMVPLFELVKTNLNSNDQFRSAIRERQGAYTRLKHYLGQILSVPFVEMLQCVAPFKLYNTDVFYDDQLFFTNAIDFLLSNDFSVSIIAAMRFNIIVFVRWMDAKIKDAIKQNGTTVLAKRLATVWEDEGLRLFINLYDNTDDFDENEQLGKVKNFELISMIEASKSFVEKVLKSKKMKSADALSNDLRKCFKPMSLKIGVDFDAEMMQMMEKNHETIRWLEEIQTVQFIKLIIGSDEFSAKLKKEIEVSPGERIIKLSNFIKIDQQIIDFFNFLGLNVLLVNINEKKEKNEEAEKTPVKKRKAKKKSKTGANSNAPKQLPILAQNDDDNKFAPIVDETEGSVDSYKTAFSEQGEQSENNVKKIEEFATNSENFDEIINDNNSKITERPNKLFKIKDFADDGILMSIYMAFIRALLTQQNGNDDEENQWLTNDLKNGDKWSTNDEMLENCCTNYEQIAQLLNVAAQKELIKLLHFHKFGRAIVNNGTIWTRLNGKQREKTKLALFKGENAYGTTSFDEFIEKIERMEFQKKIGMFL
ncbi:hypothetical protein niasHT_021253 [Heterodera trifolii]|uniref:Uncharacterized protein n=1 Tax=Heterodera trifolii TaxID=157864 RepID=A0ABD2K635_9BILA